MEPLPAQMPGDVSHRRMRAGISLPPHSPMSMLLQEKAMLAKDVYREVVVL